MASVPFFFLFGGWAEMINTGNDYLGGFFSFHFFRGNALEKYVVGYAISISISICVNRSLLLKLITTCTLHVGCFSPEVE